MNAPEKTILKGLLQKVVEIIQHIINGLDGGQVKPMDDPGIAPPPAEPVDS